MISTFILGFGRWNSHTLKINWIKNELLAEWRKENECERKERKRTHCKRILWFLCHVSEKWRKKMNHLLLLLPHTKHFHFCALRWITIFSVKHNKNSTRFDNVINDTHSHAHFFCCCHNGKGVNFSLMLLNGLCFTLLCFAFFRLPSLSVCGCF